MFIDARTVEPDATIKTQLCIIGAGAAGITLAREFLDSNIDVCLLESGGVLPETQTQDLARARCDGTIMDSPCWPDCYRTVNPSESYLLNSRKRVFGGTTSVWTGFCRPLDRIDFEPRSWVPHSGWPITAANLTPYYSRAAEILQITPFADEQNNSGTSQRPALPLTGSSICTKLFHFSPPTHFGVYREALSRGANMRILHHANVVELESNPQANRVSRARVACLNGRRFAVEARAFVLATGGVENTRLLLLSNRVQAAGLGNQYDQVGRYYMDHAHVTPGIGLFFAEPRYRALYTCCEQDPAKGHRTMGLLSLTEDAQREHRLQNTLFHLIDDHYTELGTPGLAQCVANAAGSSSPWACRLQTMVEYTPNPESRVTLTAETDALGCRRAHANWQLLPSDSENVQRSIELVARELARAGQGRVRVVISRDTPFPHAWGGAHHMGGTRMSTNPHHGVVNANCRVHQVHNVYIAGSSVFPTAGAANPTFTIVALALRLADHLREELTS